MKVSIIGIGRLGGALAIALAGKGYTIENLFARSLANVAKVLEFIQPLPKILSTDQTNEIASDVVLITTQDSEIYNIAEKLKHNLQNNPTVLHTSGALSSKILDDLREIGCAVGSVHPLISISDALLGAKRFENAYFCVEGDRQAIEIGNQMVSDLGGRAFSISSEYKTLYHAAAVTACGHLVALIDAAIEMLTACGLSSAEAQKILTPLIKSTVENLETQTTAEALTGTVARADYQTLEKHLAVLDETVSVEAFQVYLHLASRSVPLAERQGANAENLKKISEKLLLAKNNLK